MPTVFELSLFLFFFPAGICVTILLTFGEKDGKALGLESLRIASLLSSVPHTLVMCFLCVAVYHTVRTITGETAAARVRVSKFGVWS